MVNAVKFYLFSLTKKKQRRKKNEHSISPLQESILQHTDYKPTNTNPTTLSKGWKKKIHKGDDAYLLNRLETM